ncbi:MAG: hypothetical protein JWO89_3309 [Verrucomicrobiaceae bacterium]|nr:hypothetical protein [Verrucomicrobiaceae bacterium]MDB6119240.1 hypothetical protein [Verrucomicrobiaceae bacterium]
MPSPSRTFIALAWIVLGLAACSKSGPVVWPELSALDSIAEQAEGLTENHDFNGMRALVPELQPAAAKLAASPIPANATNPGATAELQSDLKDLTGRLADASKLSDDELQTLFAGIHPIVEQLMAKSGLPHVHEASHK